MLAASAERILSSLGDSAVVLDIGGWADPFPRADWVMDLMPYETRGLYDREGWVQARDREPERFDASRWIQRDICDHEPYPFRDNEIDFVICSQTLEDIRDPVWVCAEMNRVAKAGYIEVPSRLEEQSFFRGAFAGWSHHRWLIEISDGQVEFVFKYHSIHARLEQHFPPGFADRLPEVDRVQSLWWQGSFGYRERIFVDAEETDRYLSEPVVGPVTKPDVSVIVPCHGSARTVPELLTGLERQTLDRTRFEILLVDPGADGTRRVIEERLAGWTGAPVRVLPCPIAGGPAVKRNMGAAAARAELLAFTDADCVPEPRWLQAGLQARRAGFDVVQGLVLMPEGAHPDRRSHRLVVEDDHGLYESANIFYARGLFESLGGFSTRYYRRYGLPFGEDAELGWRALRAGARYLLEREAVVRHPVGPPTLRGHLREQWLARGFPELVRDVPELRDRLFYRNWFLTRESALFAAAVAGLGAAGRCPAAAGLAVPYVHSLAAEGRGRGAGRRVGGAIAKLGSDAILSAALLWGSARARRLVI